MSNDPVITKALWITGIATAVLTGILISIIDSGIEDLKEAIITNAKQDAQIEHNREGLNHLELRLKELMEVSITTNHVVIRVEEKLKSFESVESYRNE
jgi:hypothetical protein